MGKEPAGCGRQEDNHFGLTFSTKGEGIVENPKYIILDGFIAININGSLRYTTSINDKELYLRVHKTAEIARNLEGPCCTIHPVTITIKEKINA